MYMTNRKFINYILYPRHTVIGFIHLHSVSLGMGDDSHSPSVRIHGSESRSVKLVDKPLISLGGYLFQ